MGFLISRTFLGYRISSLITLYGNQIILPFESFAHKHVVDIALALAKHVRAKVVYFIKHARHFWGGGKFVQNRIWLFFILNSKKIINDSRKSRADTH